MKKVINSTTCPRCNSEVDITVGHGEPDHGKLESFKEDFLSIVRITFKDPLTGSKNRYIIF